MSASYHNSIVELSAVGLFGGLLGAVGLAYFQVDTANIAEYATLLSGFGGAILGAVVSAFVSLLLAKQAARETLARDLEARTSDQLSRALNLMVKASLVLTDIVAIRNSIDESLSEANERKLTGLPFWRRVLPIVGGHQSYEVEASELAPLIEAKEYDIVYAATDMFMQHRNLVTAVEVYSAKRGEIKEIATKHQKVADGVLVSGLTEADADKLAPYEMELESLITEIRRRLPLIQNLAEQVTFGVGPAIRKHFATDKFPMFVAKGT